jgi:hypothetical protein
MVNGIESQPALESVWYENKMIKKNEKELSGDRKISGNIEHKG